MAAKIEYADLEVVPYVPVNGEPTYMFDIDGTLALHGGRGIHDYEKVGQDEPNTPVLALMWQLKILGNNIIVLSGRPDSCREETQVWLGSHLGPMTSVIGEVTVGDAFDTATFGHVMAPWWQLYMRETGDYRPDYQVKLEIFNQEIRPYSNIVGVFDDRDQCVRLWRDLGLTTYQVAYGDF